MTDFQSEEVKYHDMRGRRFVNSKICDHRRMWAYVATIYPSVEPIEYSKLDLNHTGNEHLESKALQYPFPNSVPETLRALDTLWTVASVLCTDTVLRIGGGNFAALKQNKCLRQCFDTISSVTGRRCLRPLVLSPPQRFCSRKSGGREVERNRLIWVNVAVVVVK